jgi:hypothetical protein
MGHVPQTEVVACPKKTALILDVWVDLLVAKAQTARHFDSFD